MLARVRPAADPQPVPVVPAERAMTEALIAALSLLVGGLVGAWWGARRQALDTALARDALSAEEQAHDQTRARAQAWRDELAAARAERDARVAVEREAADRFRSLASDALAANNERFLALAETRLASAGSQQAAELKAREQAIAELVRPLGENLDRLDQVARQLELRRAAAYQELDARVGELAGATRRLDEHSRALAGALKGSSAARGRWGELTLRRVAELAGMARHVDFHEQVVDGQGTRPDMVIQLPGGGRIPVDAKAPLKDYLAACECDDEGQRASLLAAHATRLRSFVRDLARKDYADQLDGPLTYTVLFLPSEAMLGAACEVRPALTEEALEQRVLIATPVTLTALLSTVAVSWRQETVAESAQQVWDAAVALHDRARAFAGHLAGVGRGLDRAVVDYNKAVGSFVSRVLPAGRSLEQLEAAKAALEEPAPVDTARRELPAEG